MIKVKVTKNIMNNNGVIFGLSVGQIVAAGIGVVIGIGTFFLLQDYLVTDAIMWIIFLELALVIGFGVIKVNDMNMFQLMIRSLKGADKRPYSTKGVYDDDEFNIF